MVFGAGTVNVFTAATGAAGGFSDADLERIEALANLVAPLVEFIEARRMTLGLLDAFIGPRISERILKGQVKRGGEILQFIGDAILIVFGIKRPEDEAAVCDAALDAAIDAFASVAVVNHRRRRSGLREIEFGLGLHLGSVTHANVGAPNRLAFNVVGPAVNKTARLQGMTKEAVVPLLLSKEFAALIRRPLRSIGHFDLRGVSGPQEMFTVQD